MNFKNIPNINCLWSSLIVEELTRLGVEHFCLSSGSRSSLLAFAVASHKKAKPFLHFDERASAFHALGLVMSTGKPVVVITTSGTAVANCLPAVIEASKKKLPLIILTADRPSELRLTGAHQTLDHQSEIFGKFVRWSVDLPCPTLDIQPSYVLTTMDQAVYKSKTDVKGPVHLNCAFREPLSLKNTNDHFAEYLASLEHWMSLDIPLTRYISSTLQINENDVQAVAEIFSQSTNGVIIVGKLSSDDDVQAVLKLSEKLNWPIFPDAVSGLRLSARHSNVISYFDQILLSEEIQKNSKVDCVIQFGGRMTSKRFYQYLENIQPKHYVMILNHSLRHDPQNNVTMRFQSSPKQFVDGVLSFLPQDFYGNILQTFRRFNERVGNLVEQCVRDEKNLSEISAARTLTKIIPENSNLFLGNSMPLRDVEMFGVDDRKNIHVTGNRGASGIDGNMATACGFCVGSKKVTTVLLGDLAFLYDLNALSMVKDLPETMIIVVVNNQGGGIFSFLPIVENNPHFEKFWGTPHALTFEHSAKQFGLSYACPSTIQEFTDVYQSALKDKRSMIIEVRTDREENVKQHRELQEKIRNVIDSNSLNPSLQKREGNF